MPATSTSTPPLTNHATSGTSFTPSDATASVPATLDTSVKSVSPAPAIPSATQPPSINDVVEKEEAVAPLSQARRLGAYMCISNITGLSGDQK